METLYVWLITFAGATMVGCFVSSERELGKQRREINWLRRNQRSSEAQGFETNPSAELMTRNKELIEKVSALSSELEERKTMAENLQSERDWRVSDFELKQQLQASQGTIKELEAEQQHLAGVNFENQQLRDEIANLKIQFQASEIRLQSIAVTEANSLNDGLGEKNGNLIDLSSDDSAARVHVANDEEIKPSVQTSGKQKFGFLS